MQTRQGQVNLAINPPIKGRIPTCWSRRDFNVQSSSIGEGGSLSDISLKLNTNNYKNTLPKIINMETGKTQTVSPKQQKF